MYDFLNLYHITSKSKQLQRIQSSFVAKAIHTRIQFNSPSYYLFNKINVLHLLWTSYIVSVFYLRVTLREFCIVVKTFSHWDIHMIGVLPWKRLKTYNVVLWGKHLVYVPYYHLKRGWNTYNSQPDITKSTKWYDWKIQNCECLLRRSFISRQHKSVFKSSSPYNLMFRKKKQFFFKLHFCQIRQFPVSGGDPIPPKLSKGTSTHQDLSFQPITKSLWPSVQKPDKRKTA